MTYEITSYEGVGDLLFGMHREEIAKVIGKKPKQVRLAPEDKTDSDVFADEGIVVDYDSQGLMEAVEFSGPEQPTYEGKNLLGLTKTETESVDEDADEDLGSIISETLGIAFYIPVDTVESVMAFREGYYNAIQT